MQKKRFGIVAAGMLATSLLFAGPAAAAPLPSGSAGMEEVGKWDDLNPFQIEQLYLLGKLVFGGFDRFGNGDGGGHGAEDGEAVFASVIPVAGSSVLPAGMTQEDLSAEALAIEMARKLGEAAWQAIVGG